MELFKEEGRREGRAEGRAEGEVRLGVLFEKLMSLGRSADAMKVASDPAWREKLYREFEMA